MVLGIWKYLKSHLKKVNIFFSYKANIYNRGQKSNLSLVIFPITNVSIYI